MSRNERVRPPRQHTAKFEGLLWRAKDSILAIHHFGPHVVKEIGKKRQRAGILGRFLRGASGDRGGKTFDLEAGGQKVGSAGSLPRTAQPLAQSRDIDLPVHAEQRLISLQFAS